MKKFILWPMLAVFMIPCSVRADTGAFDIDRWYGLVDSVKQTAEQQGVSEDIINHIPELFSWLGYNGENRRILFYDN